MSEGQVKCGSDSVNNWDEKETAGGGRGGGSEVVSWIFKWIKSFKPIHDDECKYDRGVVIWG